jgi:hypothetical protein
VIGRFDRYLFPAERRKESFLDAIAGGASEDEALARMQGLRGAPVTMATVRAWLRDDREFAEALRVARTEPPGEPHVWGDDSGDDDVIPPPSATAEEIARRGWRSESETAGPLWGWR